MGGRFDPQMSMMESAALAIGGSHLPEALDKLIAAYDNKTSSTARRALLLPIALIRSDKAFEHLLNVVRTADQRIAVDAIDARFISTPATSMSTRSARLSLSGPTA